jgi:hypothetical protein
MSFRTVISPPVSVIESKPLFFASEMVSIMSLKGESIADPLDSAEDLIGHMMQCMQLLLQLSPTLISVCISSPEEI